MCKMPKMKLHPERTFVRKITNKFRSKIVKNKPFYENDWIEEKFVLDLVSMYENLYYLRIRN